MTQNAIDNTSSDFTVDPLAASDSYIQFNEETVAKCRICGEEKDIQCFTPKGKYRTRMCKNCRNLKLRENYGNK